MRIRVVTALAFVLLAVPPPATAETFDLNIHAYCPANSNVCGFGSYGGYWNYIREVVQEINVQWQATGISFRPAFTPVPLATQDYIDAQCGNVDGTDANELNLYRQWLQDVAAVTPDSISILLNPDTKGQGCCSQLPNNPSYPWYERFGILCTHNMQAYDLGSVLAHELGHHFCLCHTFLFSSVYGSPMDTEEFLPNDLFYGPLDWDGDDESCPRGLLGVSVDVLDTDPDPREYEVFDPDATLVTLDEDSGFSARNGHEWCAAQTNLPVDQGSTHAASCTTVCRQRANNQTNFSWMPPGTTAERAALAMSYWDDFGRCHGPWTRGGKLFNAFTPASVNRVRACRQQYRSAGSTNPLTDVCASRGGDADFDGICQIDDNCPTVRNTSQGDTDHDGIGDPCDSCPFDPTPTGDADHDGAGDACDADRDGDGCTNGVDQHPDEAKPVTGSVLYLGCGAGKTVTQTFEGQDSDGDGWVNCLDLDDDGDGVCDEGGPKPFGQPGVPAGGCVAGPEGVDPCPVNSQDVCHFEFPLPACKLSWVVCNGGGCGGFFLRLFPVGDPDLGPLTIESFQIVNDTLYIAPMSDRTLSRTAQALQGNFESLAVPAVQGAGLRAKSVDALRLEIWTHCAAMDPFYPPNPCFVALVAEYPADAADFGDVSRGRFLGVRPGGAGLEGAAVWTIGQDLQGPPPVDTDGDGWPDFHDNCPLVTNPRQTDADGDRFGNACDADLDGDFLVTAQDVEAVRGCEGADLMLTLPLVEPDWLDGRPRELPDRTPYDLAGRCAEADLDDDGIVDTDDTLLAERNQGSPPGPSAFSDNTSPCAQPGACDDGNPCTADRCVHSTGACLHLDEACDDLDPCTLDACDPQSGACEHTGPDCDDGNVCTADSCDPADGSCVNDAAVLDGAPCDDSSACTDRDACFDGGCAGTPVVTCDDGDSCTLDACDPASGGCFVAGDSCDDGNPCTLDSCGGAGCQHDPLLDGSACEDGDLCTTDDACAGGSCRAGAVLACDDGDACTVETCDPFTGECFHAPLDCDDGDICTTDACSSGECGHLPVSPAPAADLRFAGRHRMVWNPASEAGHSNTYRGTIPSGGLGNRSSAYDHVCFESADLGADGLAVSTDFARPDQGEGFYYLISWENDCGEGLLGTGPGGGPRPNDQPCLTPP